MNKTWHIGMVEYYAVKKMRSLLMCYLERKTSSTIWWKILGEKSLQSTHGYQTLSDLVPIRWIVFYHSLHLSHTSPHRQGPRTSALPLPGMFFPGYIPGQLKPLPVFAVHLVRPKIGNPCV